MFNFGKLNDIGVCLASNFASWRKRHCHVC
jgi:hypothetical protein